MPTSIFPFRAIFLDICREIRKSEPENRKDSHLDTLHVSCIPLNQQSFDKITLAIIISPLSFENFSGTAI
jgi:hypothetical protein